MNAFKTGLLILLGAYCTWAGEPTVPSPFFPCRSIAVSNDFGTVIGISRPPILQAWNVKTGKKLWMSDDTLKFGVTAIALDTAQQIVIIGTWERGLELWNGGSGKYIRTIQVEDVRAMAWSDATRTIAVVTEGSHLYLIPLAGGDRVELESATSGIPWTVGMSPDGKTLAVVRGAAVEIWDLPSRSLLRKLQTRGGHNRPIGSKVNLSKEVWQLSFSRDGTKLATGTDGYIQLWDIVSGSEEAFIKSGGRPASLRVGDDSRHVAWTNWNNEIRLWSGDKQNPRTYKRSVSPNKALFSPTLDQVLYSDGRNLVSFSLSSGKTQWAVPCVLSQDAGFVRP